MNYKYTILNTEEIMVIHENSLRILQDVGMKIYDDKLCDILIKKGMIVDKEQQLVQFPRDIIDAALKSAPETFTMHDHNGNDIPIVTGNALPAIYSNALSVWDWHTQTIRPATVKDVTICIQLAERLDEVKIACPVIIPQNSPVTDKVVHTACILLENCTKMNLAAPQNIAETIFWTEATAIADQDLSSVEGHSIIFELSPTDPLQIDPSTCEMLRYLTEHGYPLLFCPCPISGATSPFTMAGTTVQTHAEFLGMLAIAQVISEGIPCIYAGAAGPMDMRTGTLSYGCGERDTVLSAIIDLAGHFKLPHASFAGTVDTYFPDFQGGSSKALTYITRLMKGSSIGIWLGSLLTGKTVAPEQIVMDADLFNVVSSMLKGMTIDEDRMAMDSIQRVGPGGNFLMDEHTLSYMRDEDEFYTSPIVNHSGDHGKSMVDRAHDRVEELTVNFQSPVLEHIRNDLVKLLEDYDR